MDNGTKLLISRGIYRFETYTKGEISRKHDNFLFILKSCIHHKLLFSFNTLDILENTPSSSPSSQVAFNTEQNRSCSHSIVISCITPWVAPAGPRSPCPPACSWPWSPLRSSPCPRRERWPSGEKIMNHIYSAVGPLGLEKISPSKQCWIFRKRPIEKLVQRSSFRSANLQTFGRTFLEV